MPRGNGWSRSSIYNDLLRQAAELEAAEDSLVASINLPVSDAQIMEEVRNISMLWFRGFVTAETALTVVRDLTK